MLIVMSQGKLFIYYLFSLLEFTYLKKYLKFFMDEINFFLWALYFWKLMEKSEIYMSLLKKREKEKSYFFAPFKSLLNSVNIFITQQKEAVCFKPCGTNLSCDNYKTFNPKKKKKVFNVFSTVAILQVLEWGYVIWTQKIYRGKYAPVNDKVI